MEDYEMELELYKLMSELQQVSIDLEKIIEPYALAMEEIARKEEEACESLSIKSVEIQEKIKELALKRAKSLKTGAGNITYRKGGIRRKWDLDSLDLVCENNTEVREKIWNLRKEEPFAPQVLIKIDTKGKSISDL